MNKVLCLTSLFCSAVLLLAAPRLTNGGFEEPGLKGWQKFTHGQDQIVKIEQDTVNFAEGIGSAKITASAPLKVYVGMSRPFGIQQGDQQLEVSLSYKAPDAHLDLFIFYYGQKGLKPFVQTLPKSAEWKKVQFKTTIPAGATHGNVEFRVSKQGTFNLDGVAVDIQAPAK